MKFVGQLSWNRLTSPRNLVALIGCITEWWHAGCIENIDIFEAIKINVTSLNALVVMVCNRNGCTSDLFLKKTRLINGTCYTAHLRCFI